MSQVSLEEAYRQIPRYRRLTNWRTAKGEFPEAKGAEFDDSSWDEFSPGYGWNRREGERWFRREIVIPEEIHGVPVEGSRVDIRLVLLAGAELFIDGKSVGSDGYWFDGIHTLSEHTAPGKLHTLAIRSPCADAWGSFGLAEWYIDSVERMLLELGVVVARARMIRDLVSLGWLDRKKRPVRAALESPKLAVGEDQDLRALRKRAGAHDAKLLPAASRLNGFTSFLVGHAHIDMNWLWPYEETVETCRRTFSSVDKLMDEFPEFIFSQSQAAVYQIMEELHPDIFRTIQRRVKEGRWDVTASTWVENDLNMASGESLVRQTTCALNYIEDRLGVTPRVCWCPDTFGHPWTYPQILRKCGLNYYYAHRCSRQEKEHLMWWEGQDGSRVLVFDEGETYNNSIAPELVRYFPKMLRNFGLPAHLVVFGVGDHGGGPTRRDLANVALLNQQKRFPRFRHVRGHEFFEAVQDCPRIPVVCDELNFTFEGCYTTHADIKWMSRRGESMLHETEVLASLASTLGTKYPSGSLEKIWRKVLFNQFHDLLDGSAIHAAYDHSRRIFKDASKACARIAAQSEPILLDAKATRRGPRHVTIFNPLGWERTETVSVPRREESTGATVVDNASGRPIPAQVQEAEILFTARVPALGTAGYRIVQERKSKSQRPDPDAPRAVTSSRPGQSHVLENRYFRLTVSAASGTVTSLFDKRLNRELVSPSEPANLLQVCNEKPHGMSAWTIGPISRTENLLDGAESQLAYQGSVKAAIRVERSFSKSHLKQDIVIHRDLPRIDFVTEIDWQEVGGPQADSPMLKVAFPWAHSSPTCIREIPFGHKASPSNGREIPSLTFLELPGEGFGIALLNDCKYGHDAKGNTVRLTLLRAAYDPDPLPDIGRHSFTYSVFPHPGDWREAETWKRGHELNSPLRIIDGASSRRKSWVSVDAPGVDLSAVKGADDGKGLVVRLVEMHGRRVRLRINLGFKASGLWKCDLRERPIARKPIKVAKGRAFLELSPHEIGTWRVDVPAPRARS